MNKSYETMVIFDGSLPEETIRKESQALEDLLRESSSYEKTIPWGKRTLEYEIRKKRTGAYFVYQYAGENELPAKIDEHFNLNASVLRYMTIIRDPQKRTLSQVNAERAAAQQAEDGKPRVERQEETASEEQEKTAAGEPAPKAPLAETETAKMPVPETEAAEKPAPETETAEEPAPETEAGEERKEEKE